VGSLCRLLSLALVAALVAGVPGVCQPEVPLASFTGNIRQLNNNSFTIDGPDSNTLEFFCTRKTRYYDGAGKLNRSALKPGDRVSVDARRALDGTLEAVNVHRERQKPAK
jgi:hypothetical protein